MVARIGDETLHAGPGDILHMPAGVTHGWRNDGQTPLRLLVTVSLTPNSDYERMFRDLSRIDPADFEAGGRITAANQLDIVLPLAMP